MYSKRKGRYGGKQRKGHYTLVRVYKLGIKSRVSRKAWKSRCKRTIIELVERILKEMVRIVVNCQ